MAKSEADKMVRYCPECGLIGPVKPTADTCCPDSFGVSIRRWQAERFERMLARLRAARTRGVEVFQQSELDAARVRGEQIAAELAKCVARGDAAGVSIPPSRVPPNA